VRVLVLEGDRAPTDEVTRRLGAAEHEVMSADTREGAKSFLRALEPHLLVLIAIPIQAWHPELLGELQGWEQTPYIVAISDPDPANLVTLLEAGSDACCTYPLATGLLEAQVLALGRRALAPVPEGPIREIVTVRELTVDNARYQVSYAGTRLALTPAEFRILACLARRPGRVVATETLSSEALGSSTGGKQVKDVLRVHVRRIRNKIREAGGSTDYVWNIRGVGYMLERRATPNRSGRRRLVEGTDLEDDRVEAP